MSYVGGDEAGVAVRLYVLLAYRVPEAIELAVGIFSDGDFQILGCAKPSVVEGARGVRKAVLTVP